MVGDVPSHLSGTYGPWQIKQEVELKHDIKKKTNFAFFKVCQVLVNDVTLNGEKF